MAENDAERVADGVGENPEARLALTGYTGGTQSEQFLLGLIGVAHADVQMQQSAAVSDNPISFSSAVISFSILLS